MKTILTFLFSGFVTIVLSQNSNQAEDVQQQRVNRNGNPVNINVQSNVLGNRGIGGPNSNVHYGFNQAQVPQKNYNNLDNNVNNDEPVQIQVRNTVNRSRGNRSRISNSNDNPVAPSQNKILQVDNVGNNLDNNESNEKENLQLTEESQSVNVNIELPKINLEIPKIELNLTSNKTEKEVTTKTPKRLDDYRIKTSGGNSGVSHQYKKKKLPMGKKMKKNVKCWWTKHFSGEIKFKVSCECFKF